LDLNSNVSEIYITDWCSACHVVLDILKDAGIVVDVVNIQSEEDMAKAIDIWKQRLGYNPNTIPQLWYNGQYIGGSSNIEKFIKEKHVT
jgi:glutaredoxin